MMQPQTMITDGVRQPDEAGEPAALGFAALGFAALGLDIGVAPAAIHEPASNDRGPSREDSGRSMGSKANNLDRSYLSDAWLAQESFGNSASLLDAQAAA
ncbi:MAG: hypothetical protein WC670_14800 [Pseudolabrys sp.]|jgi:hypothetical protein